MKTLFLLLTVLFAPILNAHDTPLVRIKGDIVYVDSVGKAQDLNGRRLVNVCVSGKPLKDTNREKFFLISSTFITGGNQTIYLKPLVIDELRSKHNFTIPDESVICSLRIFRDMVEGEIEAKAKELKLKQEEWRKAKELARIASLKNDPFLQDIGKSKIRNVKVRDRCKSGIPPQNQPS